MKVEGQRISEIESVYVGIGQTGFGSVDNLVTVDPVWTAVLPPAHERGLVSGMYMFRHGGTEPTYTLPSGEVVKHSEAMLRRQAVVISELFKIEDGRIRRIEAVMAGGLDHDAPSGW